MSKEISNKIFMKKKQRPIKILSQTLTNQIAAGEIIERPASIVKELIENSIDSNATEILLELDQGGKNKILVRDNGEGINQENLLLALAPHATSKIYSLSDLNEVTSLGFRGEALASIKSIAKIKITSKTNDQNHAWAIEHDNKNLTIPAAHPDGTTVEVSEIFYNIPARRKFIKSEKTEYSYIDELIKKIMLCHFEIELTVYHNNKMTRHYPAALSENQKQKRIEKICGESFVENAIPVSAKTEQLELNGWITNPNFQNIKNNLQYFYVNGRFIKNKVILHAIKQAYHDVLHYSKFPAFIMYFHINPSLIDINVHPTKNEIRFNESNTVYSFLFTKIHSALENLNKFGENQPLTTKESTMYLEKNIPSIPSNIKQSVSPNQIEFNLNDFKEDIITNKKNIITTELNKKNNNYSEYRLGFAIGQLHKTFIITQTKNSLIIVDMHAAHERILYERAKSMWEKNICESQELLIPINIHLNVILVNSLMSHKKILKKMGFYYSQISEDILTIRSIPNYVSNKNIKDLIVSIAKTLELTGKTKEHDYYLNKILSTISCHKALRANDEITIAEMNHLLRQMEKTNKSSYCNHGRPTWFEIQISDLDKFFMRGK